MSEPMSDTREEPRLRISGTDQDSRSSGATFVFTTRPIFAPPSVKATQYIVLQGKRPDDFPDFSITFVKDVGVDEAGRPIRVEKAYAVKSPSLTAFLKDVPAMKERADREILEDYHRSMTKLVIGKEVPSPAVVEAINRTARR